MIPREKEPLLARVQADVVFGVARGVDDEPLAARQPQHVAGRVKAIKRHHDERLHRVREISRMLGPATVQAFSQQLFKQRSWGPMAESETYAHLEHLRILGSAERTSDHEGRYVYVTG